MFDLMAFITGSHAYGTPTSDSDIDVVVFMSVGEAEKLTALHKAANAGRLQKHTAESGGLHSQSLRFGPLNLIVVTDRKWYESWRSVTRNLAEQARDLIVAGKPPPSRNHAVLTFRQDWIDRGFIKGDAEDSD